VSWEAVIGLEVHAQMLTASKIFCGCPTTFGNEPNSQTCQICIGMPGVLPVLNKKAVEFAVRTGLATNCTIAQYSRFARKNYFYPDLPKGYQISQYEHPICEHGHIDITVDGTVRRIGITRIHMEEDAGKNIHEGTGGYSFVDLNRTGVPLMEIVSEPDIRSPKEAAEYMRKLRGILRYLGVCDGNLEQGSLRCDANVSIRPAGQKEFGTRAEVKNINSFKNVEKAIEYEIKRQIKLIEGGGKVVQETRLWDADKGITESMRSKEEAHDYRYFPDPDLVPITVVQSWIDGIKSSLPELPEAKSRRFVSDMGLPEYDADFLVSEKATAEWFEETVKLGGDPVIVCNWIKGEIIKLLSTDGKSMDECPLKPYHLVYVLNLLKDSKINANAAKIILEDMYNKPDVTYGSFSFKIPTLKFRVEAHVEQIIKEKGLVQISDSSEIEKIVDEILAKSPKEIERFKAGDEKLIGFFVGQAMKASKGKANPQMLNELLKKKLT